MKKTLQGGSDKIKMYAIVDVETTGGTPQSGKVIEIAVVLHNGNEVTGEYSTLVNPEEPLPSFIKQLTGITDEMLRNAPRFHEVAQHLEQILTGRNFIAHNVSFDYHFLKEEFKRCGIPFRPKRACTIRMSRELIPGMPSYSLGKLCTSLSIPIENRHRASGDAIATAKLFTMLLNKDDKGVILRMLKHGSGEVNLPPFLERHIVKQLPEKNGVYLFKGRKGEIIYVGKATNIRKRVQSHFTGDKNSRGKREFLERIHDIEYHLTGTEILSTLLEASLIRKHWPRYNDSLKVPGLLHGIFQYTDQRGYIRLVVNKAGKWSAPLLTFRSGLEARSFLSKFVSGRSLCPRLSGLQPGSGRCSDHGIYSCEGACDGSENPESYNNRLREVLSEIRQTEQQGLVVEKGRYDHESALIFLDKAVPMAYGFISNKALERGRIERCRFFPLYNNPELEGTVLNWVGGIGQESVRPLPDGFIPEVSVDQTKMNVTRQLHLFGM